MSVKEKVVPTKSEAKDVSLETIAMGALLSAWKYLESGQMEVGISLGVLGVVVLLLKYKVRG